MLKVDQSEISFISYCSFDEIGQRERHVEATLGIVGLVESASGPELRIIGGDMNAVSSGREIILPLSEIDYIGMKDFIRSRQLQIKRGNELIFLEVSANQGFIDREGSEKLYKMILAAGVKSFEPQIHYKPKADSVIFVPIYY